MKISKSDWKAYINALANIEGRAGKLIGAYIKEHGWSDRKAIMDYANAVISVYGGAEASLAAEMYDQMAKAEGAHVRKADPAELPGYGEVAKMVNGAAKRNDPDAELVRATTSKVKRCSADTMLQNGIRDGAEFAWIPSGDTCAFCQMLASNGWQRASKKALKGGHAEHIHDHCKCTYAIRFDGKSEIEGYDPDHYRELYDNAEGDTWEEKLNSMRRQNYAANKGRINAQKRAAYAKRHEFEDVMKEYYDNATPSVGDYSVHEGRVLKNREEENMSLLYKTLGGDIEALEEKRGQKNPDYRWKGHLWEEQEPISHSKNAINQNTREGIHQIVKDPGGIILDIGDNMMPLDEVEKIVLNRMRRSATFGCDIIIIRDGIIEAIKRFKKIKK